METKETLMKKMSDCYVTAIMVEERKEFWKVLFL